MKKYSLFSIGLLLISMQLAASQGEQAAANYLQSIKLQPEKLRPFLYAMPKGGDLHNHASGSTLAENMLQYAAKDDLCVNRTTYTAYANSSCLEADLLNNAIKDPAFLDSLIDSWSMQHFTPVNETGHDHFFNSFQKFDAIAQSHFGEIIAEISERAGEQNEVYIETMTTIDANASGRLGNQLGYDPDFARMRDNLLAHDLSQIVAGMTTTLNESENKQREILQCGTPSAKPGCQVTIRYQYQILREQAPENVFAQMLAGFEGARHDKRIVAINMVQAEDGKYSMNDYQLHMQMLDYLHSVYPEVHIALHAGELTPDIVPQAGLTFHIREAVHTAHAERIGHGVDILHETDYPALLKTMVDNGVMVEINLSSNAKILNISGQDHPLPLYLQYGVPVALSTDDEGVNREDMTAQYVDAVKNYDFDYPTLKNLVRNSITYSFLPGEKLWRDANYHDINPACSTDTPGATPGTSCQQFLSANEKANLQWELERRFNAFEEHLGK